MCGIYAVLLDKLKNMSRDEIMKYFKKLQFRGPEDSKLVHLETSENDCYLGFHRLRINDVSDKGNQPFIKIDKHKEYFSITNGEIYNHKKLEKKYGIELHSESDCEIILPLFLKIGLYATLQELDGVFGGVIIEKDNEHNRIRIFGFRDRYGVRPLYFGANEGDSLEYGFSSELKGLSGMFRDIKQFEPGYIYEISSYGDMIKKRYHNHVYKIRDISVEESMRKTRELLIEAVNKRMMSDRPMCCLLSGGLDSSLVASILSRLSDKPITTFCIGIEGGSDFKYAQMVADYIKSDHHEIVLKKEDFLEAVETVIKTIESYDITTVRASTGQYLICKYLKENTDFKVVYIGDGSDEVTGGYKYFTSAPTEIDFNNECVRLTREIHFYDGLRADRAVSCHGLETRVPFLDRDFVDYYLRIPIKYRYEETSKGNEKYLLRKSFEGYLPKEVLWRQKEAFSDGVSNEKDSWYKILENYIDSKVSDDEYKKYREKYHYLMPHTKEAYYYRKVFSSEYENDERVLPYYWLPKWSDGVSEPSARVLKSYKSEL